MKERQKERDGENQRRRKSSVAGIEPTTSRSLDYVVRTWPLCHNNCPIYHLIHGLETNESLKQNSIFEIWIFFCLSGKNTLECLRPNLGRKSKNLDRIGRKSHFFQNWVASKKKMEQKMSKPEFEIKSEWKNLVRFVSDAIFSSFSDSILAFNQSSGSWVFKQSKFELFC